MKKSKQKEGGRGLLSQKISNRLSYTIIALVGLMLVGVFVFAIAPNPGHDYRDLDLGPITINGGTSYVSVEIDRAVEAEMFRATGGYCIVDDCITSWPSGGSGGTPTLAQVLAAGADADRMIDMNSHDISDVNTLNLVNAGKISADDGTVDVQGNLNVGTNLVVASSITAGYGSVIIDSNIDLTDGILKDANTVQTNTIEDPEDGILVVNDNLAVSGSITPNGDLCLGGVCENSWPSLQCTTLKNCDTSCDNFCSSHGYGLCVFAQIEELSSASVFCSNTNYMDGDTLDWCRCCKLVW